jgi:hypothetical protein
MSDYRHQPYEVPDSTSRAASPTGSIRSSASKSTTRSRMKGALHKVKKVARSNFITEGLLKRKASTDSWGEEIPTSQETQDGVPPQVTLFTQDLEATARAYAAGAAERDDDDDDDGNDSDSLRKAAAQQAHDEETYEALVTAGVLAPEIPISAETISHPMSRDHYLTPT